MDEELALRCFEASHGFDVAFRHLDDAVVAGNDVYHSVSGACLVDLLIIDTREDIAGEHGLLGQWVLFEALVLACQHRQVVFYGVFVVAEMLGDEGFGVGVGHHGHP